MTPILMVFIYGLITALTTGLGAIPFAFVRKISPTVIARADALAAGLMLGASFGLVVEGAEHGHWQMFVGVNAGVVMVLGTQRFLRRRDAQLYRRRRRGTRQMLLVVVVMTVHSFAEGIAVGASFGGGVAVATLVTVAIAVHNIPEGVAISAVLRGRGESVWGCAAWSVFTSLPQPVMAVPAFLFVEAFAEALPYALGFAAGAMVMMVFLEILPDAYERGSGHAVAALGSLSLVAMVLFQQLL